MRRIFTLLTANGIKEGETIYSFFLSIGAKAIRKKFFESSPSELMNSLIDVLIVLGKHESGIIKKQGEIYRYSPIEVAIWDIPNRTIAKLNKKYCKNKGIDHILDVTQGSLCLFTKTNAETDKCGGIFFGQECHDKEKFTSANKELFKYVYLPVQLAKDGEGIFFEERIANRLIQMRLIRKDDEIITIRDRGGWEDLNNLTARVDVNIKRKETILTETLLATALVPSPPVTPQNLSEVIQKRKGFLNLLEIPTSVLEASAGLVYERLIPYSIKEYLVNPNKGIKKIIRETALIAAVLDSGCFNMANVRIKVDGISEITDIVEISNATNIDNAFHLNFVEVLKTDGKTVFWADLYRNLAEYGPTKSELNLEKLLQVCHVDLHDYAISVYQKFKQECLHGNWLSRKLFGS